jgi:succinate dehydrogenase/fumarate reductase cytochrome b subunit
VDTVLPRNYLKVALSYLNEGYDVVGAPFLGIPRVPNGFSKSLMILFNVMSEIQIVGRALSRLRRGFYMTIGNNVVVRREFFNRISGLCRCKADDMDLALRIWLMGGRIGVLDERVLTEIPSTYSAFRSQTIRWATNDMWALRKYLVKIIKSRRSALDKLDAVLWLLKYPVAYLGLISIITMIVMQIFYIIIPPLPILILSILTDAAGVVLLVFIIAVGKAMNYGNWDLFKSLVVGGLTMYALGFPLMVYLLKALIGDLPWFYTPKASKALLRQRLFIENATALTLVASGVVTLILGHVILAVYILLNSALIIIGYRIGTVKPMGKVNVRAPFP